ncbi:MAG: DUF4388 domain-containing protein [Bdellovibrionota bacterium]
MALQGTLRDFGIADIFQLIAQQQKNGVLELRKTGGGGLDVYFTGGLICATALPGEPPGARVLEYLARSGAITPEAAAKAPEGAKAQLTTVRDYIVDSGLLDNDTVAQIEKLYALEAVYDLFVWQDGQFQFVQKEFEYNQDSFPPISAEHILMEGFRMVDEWPSIRRVVPDASARIQKLTSPRPAAATPSKSAQTPMDEFFDLADEMKDEDEEGGLTNEEQRVLALAETGKTVQWVIDRTRMGAFEASKAVAGLVTKGYLTLDTLGPQMESAAGFFEQAPEPAGALSLSIVVIFSLLVLATGYSGVGRALFAPLRLRSEVTQLKKAQGLPRLREALEVYRLIHSKYPESLNILSQSGILPPDLVVSGDPAPYVYRVEGPAEGGTAYVLELANPGP